MYLDLVFLAGLVVVPTAQLPSGIDAAAVLLGAAFGLLAAHWLAFRLAVQVTTAGRWHRLASQELAAQLAGGLGVAALAALPFLILTGPAALRASVIALALPPAAAGMVIGRLRGHSWPESAGMGAVALAAAVAVVIIKIGSGH